MLLRLWLLVLLVCVSAFAPSRAEARAAENRTWVFLPTVTETRLETEPQVAGTHQENGLWNYEHAPGCTLAAENAGGRLVHLSTEADDILASGKLGLPSNNYAGPASNASRSGWSRTARTGLSPSGNYGAVPIPAAGEAAFSKVIPVGPMTTWQRLTGQQYTARGILDLNTGSFTRSGVNWNQVRIYGIDAAITGGTVGAGIYIWNEGK